MGNSTVSVRSVVDYVSSMGQVAPILPVGGFSTDTACTMATDTMRDLLRKDFNWKFNSFKVPPFYTNSWQTDYPSISLKTLGWIEHVVAIDINNTSIPKPRCWPEAVRDLETSFYAGSPPDQVSWYYNDRLEYGVWPGPNQTYTALIGATQTPTNGPMAILDANGNILTLTRFGVTGANAPALMQGAAPGTIVTDGSCQWTVCDPKAQGFRISPLPPQSGVVYQMNLVGQLRPPTFTTLSQMIDPVTDDFAGAFRQGFICYCYQMSPDPKVNGQFDDKWNVWQASLKGATDQGDRERDSAGFYPDRGVMAPGDVGPVGPANPYGYTNWIGR